VRLIELVEAKKLDNPTLQLRISNELNERLERVVTMYGLTRGDIVRMALAQYVGQITGAMDQMAKNSQTQAESLDVGKMMEMMIPKMIEAFKEGEVVPAHVEQGRTAPSEAHHE